MHAGQIMTTNPMVKRSAFDTAGKYDTNFRYAEDTELYMRMVFKYNLPLSFVSKNCNNYVDK